MACNALFRGIVVCFALAVLSSCSAQPRSVIARQPAVDKGFVYAQRYGDLARAEMRRVGIPASIKLAQAMVESGYGESLLSRRGNNHFGIKCHGWRGRTMYLDDDRENECFRVYDSPDQGFRDHSDFLLRNRRYGFLFRLEPTDYIAWAHGLQKAGYATNPQYHALLLSLIEKNRLYRYDMP